MLHGAMNVDASLLEFRACDAAASLYARWNEVPLDVSLHAVRVNETGHVEM